MKISVDFGGWTTTKAAVSVAAAVAISGAVGSALAISPSVDAPIKWAGGWEYASIFGSAGDHEIYTVPAGKNLLMTDITVSNFGASVTAFEIFTALGPNCNMVSRTRVEQVAVPPGGAVHLSYQTGIGFSAGQIVCFSNGSPVSFTLRGFLFTPA